MGSEKQDRKLVKLSLYIFTTDIKPSFCRASKKGTVFSKNIYEPVML